jgi:tetratricopeptide (TPR) repeat protein
MTKQSNKELPKNKLSKKDHGKQYQKSLTQVKKNKYVDIAGLAIIILLGIKIYSNTFDCSFHFDDIINIVNNKNIRNLSDVQAWWNFYPTRAVGFFTFALNYHFSQLDVKYYHLFNLIVHLINSCLVWWLTLLILSCLPPPIHNKLSLNILQDNSIIKQKKVIAFFTALLFVSHPLATQSVTYIWQRVASMVMMFYLLSLILYVKARLSNKGNLSKTLLFTCSLISAVLAMLTKENAFTLPFAIVLFEIFFLRTKKFSINFRDYRMILLLAAFIGVIMIIPLKVSFDIFKPIPPRLGHAYTVTPLNYLFTQFSVIVKYIQLLFIPLHQNLDYDFPISNNFFEIRTILCFFVILSLIILAILSFKKYRIISFGIFWFFLTLSIESSFIPLDDLIWEHRTYLPSFGFFLILTSGIYYLLWNKHKYLTICIFVIIIGSNSYLTYERNKIWKDDLSLWNDNVEKTPNRLRPLLSRGVAYSDLGQWDNAIDDYSKVLDINPKLAEGYNDRGLAYTRLGQWDMAIADFSKVIEIDPKSTFAYTNLGAAFFSLGQWEKSIVYFSKVIEIDPKNAIAYNDRGAAFTNIGQYDKAFDDFSKAIEIDPNYTRAYSNRENVYGKLRNKKQ